MSLQSYNRNMQIILLPGMDGTGLLFRPFINELTQQLPENISVQVISYPRDQVLSYAQLIKYVQNTLPPQEEVIIVAESFSGPIGYALAAAHPNTIKGVVFVATFLSPPKGLVWMLPPRLMALAMKIPLPSFLLKQLLFGRNTEQETVVLFKAALQKTQQAVLSARVQEMRKLRILQHMEQQPLEMPCTYIRAKNDQLISGSHIEEFRRIAPQLMIHEIPGPHFILQTEPKACVQACIKLCEATPYPRSPYPKSPQVEKSKSALML